MSALSTVPITQRDAKAFIAQHHRHHAPPTCSIFQVAVARDEQIVGVAMVNLPVARALNDGWTAEVSRLCTLDANLSRHAASKLYAACWRIARELGYRRLITYILPSESGVTLNAAGWRLVGMAGGRPWNHASRPRIDHHPGVKKLWEVTA